MHLTDSTQFKLLSAGRYIAIFEFEGESRVSAAAKIVSIVNENVFRCGWMVEAGYTEDAWHGRCRSHARTQRSPSLTWPC